MKYILATILLWLSVCDVNGQASRFMFIQADNRQPFYVSLNGKIYSSTGSGYVIIPKLAAGQYNFSIGFGKGSAEQAFSYTVGGSDLGFALKSFGEKGWGLFNLQMLDVTMTTGTKEPEVAKAKKPEPKPDISFDRKPDTTVTDKRPSMDTTGATTTLASKATATNRGEEGAIAPAKPVITGPPTVGAGAIKKVAEKAGDDGVSLTYVDKEGKVSDTINVVIPADKKPVASQAEVSTVTSTTKDAAAKQPIAETSKPATGSPESITSSTCKDVATEDDYTKLRRKMAKESTDDEMMAVAAKFYKSKCFSTAQVKALSTLFLSDESRYNFFVASISFVIDASAYASLKSEFIDPKFVTRFLDFINNK